MSILKQKKDYSRYYGDFRGVDFSSDHTQVADTRLAYAVNMYKDYQSSQGQALETIAGYRRMFEAPNSEEVLAIHYYEVDKKPQILIHAGDKLYAWENYPHTVNTALTDTFSVVESDESVSEMTMYTVDMGTHVSEVRRVIRSSGEDITQNASYSNGILTIARSDMVDDEAVTVTYIEGKVTAPIYDGMQRRASVSVIMNNLLYIIDGEHYLVYDGKTIKNVADVAYVPTTYINIIPNGENADIGTEYEQRNMLQPRFKHTFIADGVNMTFNLNERDLESIDKVSIYGETLDPASYEVDLAKGSVILREAPKKPEEATGSKGESYPEFYAGVEITACKTIKNISGITSNEEPSGIITGCRIACVFDNRLFLSGNPKYPNHIFWCGRNNTGYIDPTYFGQLNYVQDGVGVSKITGMIPIADTLMVLKSDSIQDGTVFFHTPTGTDSDILTRTYPSEQGLNGIGCLGACVNFLDDPIFISKLGVEAVGQLSVRYERATEHRSNTIDAALTNLDLSKARLEEWNGYLVLLVEGKIFLADSRQRFTDEMGNYQYEWYYLEDIGVYKDQYLKYVYSKKTRGDLVGKVVKYCTKCGHSESKCVCGVATNFIEISLEFAKDIYNVDTGIARDFIGETANAVNVDGTPPKTIHHETIYDEDGGVDIVLAFTVEKDHDRITREHIGYRAFICEATEEMIGGEFSPAVLVRVFNNNIFFGTKNGVVCGFNFDKRDEYGDIGTRWYTFDNRAIRCGVATKMDNCGIPHLTKTTVKKSTVIKTKTMQASAAKIKVRTNRKEYEQIARINNSIFSFADIDFEDLVFVATEQSLFAVKEKEKKWVEKQYFIYSDEFRKPFALFYVVYRYTIVGRYKE